MTTAVVSKEGLSWLFKEKYTFDGDGELTSEERDWVVGYAAASRASDSLVEELKSCTASEDIEQ
ncbi:hypothetical protein [Pleurocapsa sp. PCC 7319]|uniref:hypothetical protein n=1 Tax=Pleurocapsa sp. PCC 7319 TaxID=118161 RepID=UPI00034A3883|nr:hypothetical protein [Pleurocapsa sp. PCC 7319]